MGLFNFSDINFNVNNNVEGSPLGVLEKTPFEKNTYRYPLDIGNSDKGHYLVIYIRQQQKTSFSSGTETINESQFSEVLNQAQNAAKAKLNASLDVASKTQAQSQFGGDVLNKINSGLSSISSATGVALDNITSAIGSVSGGVVNGINNLFGQKNITFPGSAEETKKQFDVNIKKITGGSTNLLRKTALTTDAIALYMPDTLNYSHQQSYDQLNPGSEFAGQAYAAVGKPILDAFQAGEGVVGASEKVQASIKNNAGPYSTQAVTSAAGSDLRSPQSGQIAFTAFTGLVQNPMLELIYKSPNFRTFQFDFMFYPRDEREAIEVQRIIERLKFHQAPEIAQNTPGFLVPPSEFDIKFYYAGAQNPNIPPIATCVLVSMDVNYAPNGFSAYEVPGENQPSLGRTGMPVAIQLTLQFQEITFLTKTDYKNKNELNGMVS